MTVLVVDDEPGICSGVSRILRNFSVSYPFMDEDMKFRVLEAGTGEEGIERVQQDKVSGSEENTGRAFGFEITWSRI